MAIALIVIELFGFLSGITMFMATQDVLCILLSPRIPHFSSPCIGFFTPHHNYLSILRLLWKQKDVLCLDLI